MSGSRPRLNFRVGDKDVPVKSDSDDSDDEYDAQWNMVLMSKETYRKYQTQLIKSRINVGGSENSPGVEATSQRQGQTPPSVIKVTHYSPSYDKIANRERSIRALERTRDIISERTGRPPRLVVDDYSGMLLSRDAVTNQQGGTEISEKKGGAASVHYDSSIKALERLRDLRLLRRLDDAMGD